MKRVKIAILDTGIAKKHTVISEHWEKNVKQCKSWIDGEGDKDVCGHGTHAAALLMRIAPEAQLYVARVVKDFESPLDPEIVAQVCSNDLSNDSLFLLTLHPGHRSCNNRLES